MRLSRYAIVYSCLQKKTLEMQGAAGLNSHSYETLLLLTDVGKEFPVARVFKIIFFNLSLPRFITLFKSFKTGFFNPT